MKAVIAVYRVHWGFSSRALFGSAVQPSYLLPPPTTILGALAKALADLGLLATGEFTAVPTSSGGVVVSGAARILDILGEHWWATAAWLSPVIRTGILVRYFTGPYQSFQTRRVDLFTTKKLVVSQLFAPLKLGYTLSPHGKLAVLVALEDGDINAVRMGLAHVSRVGSKESFVDPITIYQVELKPEESLESIITPWLTLSECAESVEGNYVIERTPMPVTREELLCLYSVDPCSKITVNLTRLKPLREAIHPRYPGWARIKPNTNKCRVMRFEKPKPVFGHGDYEVNKLIRYMLAYTRVLIPSV